MSTDLKTVSDRPQHVLKTASPHVSMQVAAETLNEYEVINDVTFAALDNGALAEVRREYERFVRNKSNVLGAAINDLLGLDD